MKPGDLAKTLFDRYNVWTVAIDGVGVHGVRSLRRCIPPPANSTHL